MTSSENITSKRRHRFSFAPLWLELTLFVLVLGTALFLLLAASPAGTRGLFQIAQKLTLGSLTVGKVEGTLWDGLRVYDLRWTGPKLQLSIDKASLDWQPSRLLHDELVIDHLTIGKIIVDKTTSKEPPKLPQSLHLPFAVDARNVTLARLTINGRDWADDGLITVHGDGTQYDISLDHIALPWFDGKGQAHIQAERPFQLAGTLQVSGMTDNASWQVSSKLSGQLNDLSIIGTGSGGPSDIPPFRADFDVRIDPFASSPYALLKAGRLETRSVDLHVLSVHLPRSSLDISLFAQPEGPTVATQIKVQNSLAGTLQAARLPLAGLDANVHLNASGARIDHFIAQTAAGKVSIVGTASMSSLGLLTEFDKLALSQFGGPDIPVSGQMQLTGSPSQPAVRAKLTAKPISIDFDGALTQSANGRVLTAKRLLLDDGKGQLDVDGHVLLAGNKGFQVDGKFLHFNPSVLTAFVRRPVPDGTLNGHVKVSGTVVPLTANVDLKMEDDSRLNGRPLSGHASATYRPDHVDAVNVDLKLADNHLQATGAFGRVGDSLNLDMLLPNLADMGNGFAGRLDAKLKVAGNVRRPTVEGNARADGLHLPGEINIAKASLSAKLDAAPNHPLDSPVSLKLDVSGLSVRTLAVDNGHLALYGNQASHGADLQAQGKLAGQGFDLVARATGAMDAHGWHGRIERLENSGDWPLRLNEPARLALTSGSVAIDGLDAEAIGTKLHLLHADWQGAHFAATGDVTDLALGEWTNRIPELKRRFSTDLIMSAHFDLHGDDRLAGSFKLERQSGDVLLIADEATIKPMPLKLSSAKAGLDLNGDRATVALDVRSDAFGSAAGQLTTQFVRTEKGWRPAPGAALDGQLRANMPSLAWVAPFLGPTAGVAGKLSAELTANGYVGDPRWFGKVNLEGFTLRLPEFGANWHDGSLAATLQGDNLELASLSLLAGKGSVSAQGRMALHNSGPEGALTVKFDHFAAISRPDRNVVASGETTLAMQGNALTLTGKLKTDEGRFELIKTTVQSLGDDITVAGRVSKPRTQAKTPPLTLNLDLDLGDRFQFKGVGADARLSGSLNISASPTQRLAISGPVKVEEGRYAAYGQNLVITRGVVTFQGAIDNPALDIQAERKNLPIEVGVNVGGTAQALRLTLTSDQAIPDSEKLSWLILGHGSTSASAKTDTDMLMTAAEALFSGSEAVGIRQQLASRLGLDDISVGRSSTNNTPVAGSDALPIGTTASAATNSTVAATGNNALNSPVGGRVVSLGKRLSDNVYIGYEQSIDGIGYAVKLTYQFTKNISLALTAGQTSSVDVLYSWLFN